MGEAATNLAEGDHHSAEKRNGTEDQGFQMRQGWVHLKKYAFGHSASNANGWAGRSKPWVFTAKTPIKEGRMKGDGAAPSRPDLRRTEACFWEGGRAQRLFSTRF